MSQKERDSQTAKQIFLDNLLNLGLLEIELKKDKEHIKCSSVGDLLIRRIFMKDSANKLEVKP